MCIRDRYDGDSGYAQNIYGGNPHTQGRGHPYCLGTMRNPSFGMEVVEVEKLN